MQLNFDLDFPPVKLANESGLLAIGGDVSPGNLLLAYSQGIFPWYSDDEPVMWWSPNPRMIMKPADFKASKSLKKLVREGKYSFRIDTAFAEVMHQCAHSPRSGQIGTWITPDLTAGFIALHESGFAHSFEVFVDNKLVGGLYGLAIEKVFFGESMFYQLANASKLAFYHFIEFLKQNDFKLIDAQQETTHLKSLGAYTVTREDFIDLLNIYVSEPSLCGNWGTKVFRKIILSF